jgi:hypothetical protein
MRQKAKSETQEDKAAAGSSIVQECTMRCMITQHWLAGCMCQGSDISNAARCSLRLPLCCNVAILQERALQQGRVYA